MLTLHHRVEIVNNEECNKEESAEIHVESTVQYVLHWDHMHEINYIIVHNMAERLENKTHHRLIAKIEEKVITIIG